MPLPELQALAIAALEALKRLAVPRDSRAAEGFDLAVAESAEQAVLRFADAFDRWFAWWQDAPEASTVNVRSQLTELQNVQAQVVQELQVIQKSQPAALRALKKRGKALIRYVDGNPERVSTRRRTNL